jgi:hypothetical protein
MKCVVCHEEQAQFYDDLDDLFVSNKQRPYCKNCHDNKFEYLERPCRVCTEKHRECCC